jgi:hypothetical protein
MPAPVRTAVAAVAATLAALLAAPGAGAVVPPTDCGRLAVAGKRLQVKVDQISCRDGLGYTKRYVREGTVPRGYACRRFTPRRGRVLFSCSKGRRVFFAIRR